MLNRRDDTHLFTFGGLLLAALGCGVQVHPLSERGLVTGAAGDVGTITGGAGTTGTAGSTANTTGSGGDAGLAGTGGPSGAAGVGSTGAAGSSDPAGSAGTTGSAGTPGAAGSGAAGTGASGVTVNLGGMNVAKENAIAFIHVGHSNMAGRGRNPTASRAYHFTETDPRAWMYHSPALAPFTGGAKGGFELAIEPKVTGDRSAVRTPSNLAGGPGTTLVKQAAAMAPSKHFISVGYGVASVYCSEYLPGGLYYPNISTPVKELKGKVTFAAIMIYLGITERHGTTADINNYPSCINQLVTALRNDAGEPNLPVIINGYEVCSNRALAPTSAFAQAIIPRIAMIPTTVSNSAVVSTDNPVIPCEVEPSEPDGDHHFTLDGHREYVRRLLQTMKDKGWWKW
jgi:hypothetical protein